MLEFGASALTNENLAEDGRRTEGGEGRERGGENREGGPSGGNVAKYSAQVKKGGMHSIVFLCAH